MQNYWRCRSKIILPYGSKLLFVFFKSLLFFWTWLDFFLFFDYRTWFLYIFAILFYLWVTKQFCFRNHSNNVCIEPIMFLLHLVIKDYLCLFILFLIKYLIGHVLRFTWHVSLVLEHSIPKKELINREWNKLKKMGKRINGTFCMVIY